MNDHWSARNYADTARFVSDLGEPLLTLLNPQPGQHILDIGCGDGALTAQIAATGARVTGIDSSADMVAAARSRGIDARVMDAQALTLEQTFDGAFSNAALHWMPRPEAVFAGVFSALRPGAVFVAEQGGHGNIAAIRTALIAALAARGIDTDLTQIWSFPTAAAQAKRLQNAGFVVEDIRLFARPTPVPAGLKKWLETLAAPVLALVSVAERADLCAHAAMLAKAALCDDQGQWTADYMRLRFVARKPVE